MTYTTFEGQNIVDLALQLYGDPLAFFTLLEDNPQLSLDEDIAAGTQVMYHPQKTAIKNQPLVAYFSNKLPQAIIVKTGN